MVDNIIYSSKFPNPPKFRGQLHKEICDVPKYYGFDHPCTKWLLGSIVSNQALLRLLKVASVHRGVMKRYHQIPDKPGLIMKNKFSIERPAYNHQAILYLTPLSLAIYMKYDDALSQLVNLKGCDNRKVVDPYDRCFVQNFWRKGESRYFTDLVTTYPAVIAIRRNYFTAFTYLLMAGYCPNDSFSLTYRKPHREIVVGYKDLIDFVIEYLRSRPAFNVGLLMHVLLHSTKDCENVLDIFCFDYIPASDPTLVSLFQRVVKMALQDGFISEENGMHIINVLEKIQEAGFFHSLPCTFANEDRTIKGVEELLSIRGDNKLGISELHMMEDEQRNSLIDSDHRYCISHLITWLITRSLKRKTEQNIHLLNLLVRVFFDTKYITIFFKSKTRSNEHLLQRLSEFPNLSGKLDESTVILIRNHVIHVFRQCEQMIITFMSRYKMEPNEAFLGSEEVTDDFKYSWIKCEMTDNSFRKKYLQGKSNNVSENHSNSMVFREPSFRNKVPFFEGTSSSLNQNNIRSLKEENDYWFVPSKARKVRSFSTENFKIKRHVMDKTFDVTAKSFESLDGHDRSESLSVSSTVDLEDSTTIEIDMMTEMKTSSKMCSEVVVHDDDYLSGTEYFNTSSGMLRSRTFGLCTTSSIPPPLTERSARYN